MSITGLIIAIGLLIDNAIVMVDEVRFALKSGDSPTDAVRNTVRHLFVPLLGSTVTTALAFAPIALMPGPAGEFVGSISISVILAIFSSLFVSMTIVPSLTTLGVKNEGDNWFSRGVNFEWISRLYSGSLKFFFNWPVFGIAFGVAFPIIGFVVGSQLPEQFFPPADRDQFQIELELPSQTSVAETTRVCEAAREFVLSKEHVQSIDWFIGESAPTFYYNVVVRKQNSSNYAQAFVQLDSAKNSGELITRLQKEMDRKFPMARVLVRQLEQGPPFDAPVEIRLFGPDIQVLRDIGDEVRGRLARIENVIHTRSDMSSSINKLKFVVDEEQVRSLGLDHRMIADQLESSLEGAQGGTVLESTEELPVRVRVSNEVRGNLSEIGSLEISSPQTLVSSESPATQIPLSAIGEMELQSEPATIVHRSNQRINEVQAYLVAGVLPDTVMSEFQRMEAEDPIRLPLGYRIEIGGEAAERDDAVGSLMSSVGILFVMMIATLVMSFGSFRMAGMILCVAGLSLGLGFFALWLFEFPFGFMAIIGSMGLMGVAINDAIVVLAAIRADEQASAGDKESIRRVVMQSTRHVIATTLTTMAGFAPLVLGGGGFWPPMAIAIAGGVFGATILALYFIPSLYLLLKPKCLQHGAESLANQ